MPTPSTQNLQALPSRIDFIRITKAISTLDAIVCPEWSSRYYSFNSNWDENEQMASMRNGCGDDWKAHVTASGIIVFGVDHESDMYRVDDPWEGLLENVPDVFSASVSEPTFDTANLSVCTWLLEGSDQWEIGNIAFPSSDNPDGSEYLFELLDGSPSAYKEWAEGYYEREVNLPAIEQVYNHVPLTERLVQTLNPELTLSDVEPDIRDIGFPTSAA